MAKTFCTGLPRMKLAVENCCEAHDYEYSERGTMTRKQADDALYECLKRRNPALAKTAWLAVRMWGWMFFRR